MLAQIGFGFVGVPFELLLSPAAHTYTDYP
jgi:hypothetical protein